MNCQAKWCNEEKDIQYVIVNGDTETIDRNRKEYYCQVHLRERIFQLELMKLAGKIRGKIIGHK